jgi:hypothetical protein
MCQSATPMSFDRRNHGQWRVVCIVGVAVCEPSVTRDARQWSRIYLQRMIQDQFELIMRF